MFQSERRISKAVLQTWTRKMNNTLRVMTTYAPLRSSFSRPLPVVTCGTKTKTLAKVWAAENAMESALRAAEQEMADAQMAEDFCINRVKY